MSDEKPEKGAVFRDARMDKLVSWGLTTVASVALSVGAWFFSRLDGQMSRLDASLGQLRGQIAVLEADSRRMTLVEARLHALETVGSAPLRAEVDGIKERLRSLESRPR